MQQGLVPQMQILAADAAVCLFITYWIFLAHSRRTSDAYFFPLTSAWPGINISSKHHSIDSPLAIRSRSTIATAISSATPFTRFIFLDRSQILVPT
ncbi:hypothetical protein LMH87_004623 [Akanthomyces muscarius]|uniref:Uncharacterized protein n=1 Tax=Akanthomyces muscarius TaxID=2231603 RepID=A0A9W8Q610_AKAMU|nr:hypothetical protein LMH87_004623 [Akanthomyces muscarius]KAJ4145787.1 hypothetical protein LMH87_004623 [Akanthomyces muscarius]